MPAPPCRVRTDQTSRCQNLPEQPPPRLDRPRLPYLAPHHVTTPNQASPYQASPAYKPLPYPAPNKPNLACLPCHTTPQSTHPRPAKPAITTRKAESAKTRTLPNLTMPRLNQTSHDSPYRTTPRLPCPAKHRLSRPRPIRRAPIHQTAPAKPEHTRIKLNMPKRAGPYHACQTSPRVAQNKQAGYSLPNPV